jgi:chromosomal replication initiation ATPase DnaA
MISPYVYAGLKPCTEMEKIEVILSTVAQICNVDKNAAAKGGRGRDNVQFRQIAAYIMRHHTELSLKQIGKWFNNQDHSTVINSLHKVENALQGYDSIMQERAMQAIETLKETHFLTDNYLN